MTWFAALSVVVEGVTATVAFRGIQSLRASKATQEELSPAEERLSSCPGLHLWRLACVSTETALKRQKSFARIWLRMGAHFARWRSKYTEWLHGNFWYQPWREEMRWDRSPGVYSCVDRSWMILLQQASVHRLWANYRMDLLNSAVVLLASVVCKLLSGTTAESISRHLLHTHLQDSIHRVE